MITIEQLKDVKDRTEELYRYLGIESKQIEVEEEQLRTQAPGFWDDAKAAEAQMKKIKQLKFNHFDVLPVLVLRNQRVPTFRVLLPKLPNHSPFHHLCLI